MATKKTENVETKTSVDKELEKHIKANPKAEVTRVGTSIIIKH